MYKSLQHISILLLLVFLISATSYIPKKESIAVTLIQKIDSSKATQPIYLTFKNADNCLLYCNNSFGSTLIAPDTKSDTSFFKIPDHFTKKTGLLRWKLIKNNNELLSGTIEILPSNTKTHVETYFGPRSILAGGNDFSMFVAVPTDSYDNPVKTGTDVFINHQFLSSIKTDKVPTKNFISWKNIFSYKPAGRILVSSICNNTSSKELTTIVYANNPTDFTISAKRNHDFADGNQITYFQTSVIKDQYNNIVSDGTLVEFNVINKEKMLLKTFGTTIKGIAQAKMLHPDHEEIWTVNALVPGMAESNSIKLRYKQVLKDFDVEFTNGNREVNIGVLTSFMEQPVADGFIVKLYLFKKDSLIETKIKTSFKGKVSFKLSKDFYASDIYNFKLESGGIIKEFSNIKLDE